MFEELLHLLTLSQVHNGPQVVLSSIKIHSHSKEKLKKTAHVENNLSTASFPFRFYSTKFTNRAQVMWFSLGLLEVTLVSGRFVIFIVSLRWKLGICFLSHISKRYVKVTYRAKFGVQIWSGSVFICRAIFINVLLPLLDSKNDQE